MRFNCQVEINNRSFPQSGGKLKSTLTLGGYGATQDITDLWILLQTAQNKVGTRYKLNGNIKTLFTKFINEGKFTLRLCEPEIDLIVSTEPKIAKKFFVSLRNALDPSAPSPSGHQNLTNLETAANQCDPTPVKKLCVHSVEELKALKGVYPSTLEALKIVNSELEKIDLKIFRLEHLKILRLNGNRILYIPKCIELSYNLTELHLPDNKLGLTCRTEKSWDWLKCPSLCNSLKVLDLSSNEIEYLPNFLPRLRALHTLHINSNKLTLLPNNIGLMLRLKYLAAKENPLRYLPISLPRLQLHYLGLSESHTAPHSNPVLPVNLLPSCLSSLRDAAAQVVLDLRLPYDERTLPREIITHLESSCFCTCGLAMYPPTVSNFQAARISRLADMADYSGSGFILLGYRKCWKSSSRKFACHSFNFI